MAEAYDPSGSVAEETGDAVPNIPLFTVDFVPNRVIGQGLGMVMGLGASWFGSSRDRVESARSAAISDLINNAAAIGADAVIGVTVTISGVRGAYGYWNFGQSAVVQASGTAVALVPVAQDKA